MVTTDDLCCRYWRSRRSVAAAEQFELERRGGGDPHVVVRTGSELLFYRRAVLYLARAGNNSSEFVHRKLPPRFGNSSLVFSKCRGGPQRLRSVAGDTGCRVGKAWAANSKSDDL
jgi:hypothetical protein